MALSISNLVVFFGVCLIGAVEMGSIPKDIALCKMDDPKRDECILATIEKNKPRLAKGIPSANLVPLEPFTISEVVIDKSSENSVIRTNLTNVVVTGGSNFLLSDITTNLDKNSMELVLKFPKLTISSNYQTELKVIGVQFAGTGKSDTDLLNCLVTIKLQSSIVEKNGKKYYNLESVKSSIDINGGRMKLVDDDKSNQSKADQYANIFNQNPRGSFKITKGIVEETADLLVEHYVKPIFDTVPCRDFFL